MANTKNAIYVAFSRYLTGWHVYTVGQPGESREAVEERAKVSIINGVPPYRWDIYTQTLLKNLEVVSKSAAVRSFPDAWRRYQEYEQYLDEEAAL